MPHAPRFTETGAYTPQWAARNLLGCNHRLIHTLKRFVGPTFVDIGAGMGHYVRALRQTWRVGYGIDGIEGVELYSGGLVRQIDLARPLSPIDKARCPIAHTGICIETGEHIPAEFAEIFLDNVASLCGVDLFLSWAPPDQPGKGHVNCQPESWLAEQLARRGLPIDARRTARLRAHIGRKFGRKLLIARREVPYVLALPPFVPPDLGTT